VGKQQEVKKRKRKGGRRNWRKRERSFRSPGVWLIFGGRCVDQH